jgi:hypothetical protein
MRDILQSTKGRTVPGIGPGKWNRGTLAEAQDRDAAYSVAYELNLRGLSATDENIAICAEFIRLDRQVR